MRWNSVGVWIAAGAALAAVTVLRPDGAGGVAKQLGSSAARLTAATKRLSRSMEADEMLQAKWQWDDPQTPAQDLIEIVVTQQDDETMVEFREAVRQAKATFPPCPPPAGG